MLVRPGVLLRLESAALAAVIIALYARTGGSWLLFALLLLAPDLSMLGYLAGTAWGSAAYNIVHAWIIPLALAVFGYLSTGPLFVHLGLIWLAHIAIDRTVGYGLKYPTGFRDTHLDRV